MLSHLVIHNLALIDTLEIDVSEGLTILTGETGAGKSIIFDALSLILGARASKDMIRVGADKLQVEAHFQIPPNNPLLQRISSLGVPHLDDGELIVRREVTGSGSRSKVNGQGFPLAVVAEIGALLVDFHGQHDQQSLLRAPFHQECLDIYGRLLPLVAEVRAAFKAWNTLQGELRQLREKQRDRSRLLDILQFQVDEIRQADLTVGEDEALAETFQILSHAEMIRENLGKVVAGLLESETSVLGELAHFRGFLDQAARHMESLAPSRDTLESARLEIEGIAEHLARVLDSVEADPQRLEEVIERQELLKSLKRKYGATIQEILEFCATAEKDLDDLSSAEERFDRLEADIAAAEERLAQHSRELSRARRKIAKEFEERVTSELQNLSMKRARLSVSFADHGTKSLNYTPTGIDHLEFLFAPNAGNPPKPLRKIASGGEMSRVMLALKTVLAEVDTVPILVFDEIDTGIGGDAANAVGERLARLGQRHQVLCVTHLPQIARFASSHCFVEKQEAQGVTTTSVRFLSKGERIDELARMLSGKVTSQAKKHAEEMLESR